MELIINIIYGKFRNYSEVRSPKGYCFYDIDAEEKNYLEYIITPIIDVEELKRKFVLVYGNVEVLNKKLQEESEILVDNTEA